ncbi:MAG: DDE-type integrase/transposase/recombinase, partial [Pseudonocardiaceae bacterium]
TVNDSEKTRYGQMPQDHPDEPEPLVQDARQTPSPNEPKGCFLETDQSKDRHRASARPHRQWCRKFGQAYANGLRRRGARPGDKWHLRRGIYQDRWKDHYLWRAVDPDGAVLDILVTSHRDAKAATRFFRKLLRGLRSVPRVLVTDKLASYGVAHRRLIPSVEHRRSKCLNNRAENVRHEVARNEWITLTGGRYRSAA